jgi:hypothetical protein
MNPKETLKSPRSIWAGWYAPVILEAEAEEWQV